MLVSKCKAREKRAGAPDHVYLVPELCRMTGLSDAMRSNLQLMKAVADQTRRTPAQKVNNLLAFAQRLLKKQPVTFLH
jgi:aubergine